MDPRIPAWWLAMTPALQPRTTIEIAADSTHIHSANARNQLAESGFTLANIVLMCEADIKFNVSK